MTKENFDFGSKFEQLQESVQPIKAQLLKKIIAAYEEVEEEMGFYGGSRVKNFSLETVNRIKENEELFDVFSSIDPRGLQVALDFVALPGEKKNQLEKPFNVDFAILEELTEADLQTLLEYSAMNSIQKWEQKLNDNDSYQNMPFPNRKGSRYGSYKEYYETELMFAQEALKRIKNNPSVPFVINTRDTLTGYRDW